MKFFLKQSFLPALYVVLMDFTAFGVCSMDAGVEWLQLILLIGNLALYVYVVAVMAFKDGQDAVKIRNANDVERRFIIETGEDRPLKEAEEYKPWKGFIPGLIVCVPLIIFIIVHTILLLCGNTIEWIEFAINVPYFLVSGVFAVLKVPNVYFTLLAIPFICGATGIPYILGARKYERQQEQIKQKHAKIYGNK